MHFSRSGWASSWCSRLCPGTLDPTLAAHSMFPLQQPEGACEHKSDHILPLLRSLYDSHLTCKSQSPPAAHKALHSRSLSHPCPRLLHAPPHSLLQPHRPPLCSYNTPSTLLYEVLHPLFPLPGMSFQLLYLMSLFQKASLTPLLLQSELRMSQHHPLPSFLYQLPTHYIIYALMFCSPPECQAGIFICFYSLLFHQYLE